jgi:hypothetical protein
MMMKNKNNIDLYTFREPQKSERYGWAMILPCPPCIIILILLAKKTIQDNNKYETGELIIAIFGLILLNSLVLIQLYGGCKIVRRARMRKNKDA